MGAANVMLNHLAQPLNPRRNIVTIGGRLAGSANLDYDKLKCYYRCCFLDCCISEDTINRTYVDVYENRIEFNVPRSCICGCCPWDAAQTMYFDRMSHDLTAGGCCTPCPYFCPHNCNYCGETLIFKKGCGCPTGFGHWGEGCFPFCCCAIDVIAGLQPGEAQRLNVIIQQQRAAGLQRHMTSDRALMANVVLVQYNLASTAVQVPPGTAYFAAPIVEAIKA
jgi:hypothetical protein